MLECEFGQAKAVGDVLIGNSDGIPDLDILGRTTDHVTPNTHAFIKLDHGNVIRHVLLPNRSGTAAHDQGHVNPSLTADRLPLRSGIMTMGAQRSRRITKALACGTLLQCHGVVAAAVPERLGI